jgi:signal transduction histidine kinase/CheY-like chemotaxis protein
MLLRKLIWTAVLVSAYIVAVVSGDYVFDWLILGNPAAFTPKTDVFLTLMVGTPITFYLVGQRFDLRQLIRDREQLAQALARARDEAEAATRAKSDFLANMTHELRTPLNAISGFSGLLRQSERLDASDARHVALIESASHVLLHVVNEVLDFSKLEAGALEFELKPFDPLALAQSTAAILSHQAEGKGLSLAVDGPDHIAPMIGDPARLRQVLLNFLSNAIKFTDHGAVRIVVARKGDEARPVLRLDVIDQGIGIAEDQIDKIFSRFVQADASVTRQFGGTGLGLAIAKRIIEAMGGEIGATSRPGEGSIFWFEVPLKANGADEVDAAEDRELLWIRPGLRVLVVDDNAANRELIIALLAPFNLNIETAQDGAQAVTAATLADFDLILMDVRMPVMDGLAATRLIRAGAGAGPGRSATPILAMTANVMPDQIALCLEAGMNDHLGKPIHPARMLEAIAR